MITFNREDFYLKEILDKSGLIDLETNANYYIYGLKKDRKCVEISYKTFIYPYIHRCWGYLHLFLSENQAGSMTYTDDNYKTKDKFIVKIGLRLNLRENIELSSNILKTAIYLFEKKMEIENFEYRKKIRGFPKFD
jgi:hypothetical protein